MCSFEGHAYVLSKVNTLHPGAVDGDVQDGLRLPMPGKVIALLVEVGASVMKGAPLLVMEAVKMEHTIAAPEAGVVVSFHCAPGDLVSEGVDLVELQMDAAQ